MKGMMVQTRAFAIISLLGVSIVGRCDEINSHYRVESNVLREVVFSITNLQSFSAFPNAMSKPFSDIAMKVSTLKLSVEKSGTDLDETKIHRFFQSVAEVPMPDDRACQAGYFYDKTQLLLTSQALFPCGVTNWLSMKLVHLLGEINQNLIENYETKGTKNPGFEILVRAGVASCEQLKSKSEREEYRKALEDNKMGLIENERQSILRRSRELVLAYLELSGYTNLSSRASK